MRQRLNTKLSPNDSLVTAAARPDILSGRNWFKVSDFNTQAYTADYNFILNAIRLRFKSTSTTFTVTCCWSLTTSLGSLMNRLAI